MKQYNSHYGAIEVDESTNIACVPTRGRDGDIRTAFIDAEDVPLILPYRWVSRQGKNTDSWYAEGRRFSSGRNVIVPMHRLILGLTDPKVLGDHIDGDGMNNRRQNLRPVTIQQNNMNRRSNRKSISQFKGVSWNKARGKWVAYIKVNRKQQGLGYFDDEIEAARAYDRAAIRLHGGYARLNLP